MQEWVQITKYFPRIEELNFWKNEMDKNHIENVILKIDNRYALWRIELATDPKEIKQHLPRKGIIINERSEKC